MLRLMALPRSFWYFVSAYAYLPRASAGANLLPFSARFAQGWSIGADASLRALVRNLRAVN